MKFKLKKLSMLIFVALFINDVCQYIKVFVDIKKIDLQFLGLFASKIEGETTIYNVSCIYLFIFMGLYFITHFFRRERKYYYE